MTEMFNSQFKQLFLNRYPSKSQATYRSVFDKTSTLEHTLRKDLFNFNMTDIEMLFRELCIDYPSTARSYGRIITAYISWAIDYNDEQNSAVNPLKSVTTNWFEQFANEDAKLFFTEKEISDIERFCENAQDAVIVRLLFEGVQGKAVSELRNLKKSDVNFESGRCYLTDEDGYQRTLVVSDKCLKLIKEASNELTYLKFNGQMQERDNIRNYTDLVDNDYVIRSSNTGKGTNMGAVDKFVIYRRITTIEQTYGLQHFNMKNISRSGMLYEANRMIKQENKKLSLVMLIYIAERFKVNSSSSLKSFITEENIEKVYGKE